MARGLRLALVVAALAAAFAPLPAATVESTYSRAIYLVIQRRITGWSNAVPFAVTDVLLVSLAAVVVLIVWRGWRMRTRKGAWAALGQTAVSGVSLAAAAYLVFLGTWGLNYRREPLASRLDFDRSRVTDDSVRDLGRSVVARLNALRPNLHDADWPDWDDLPAELGPAFDRVQRQLARVEPAAPGLPKWSVLTFYFERAGVSGMTDPFALEVVVDRSQLPFERPFVTAHEWAHLAGYAAESEANFIGWLVCFQGPPVAQYSGNLALLMYVLRAVPRDEARSLLAALAPAPRADLAAIARHAERTWDWLQRPAWWVYDRYLRANQVPQGVRSYGVALQLVAGTRFEKPWVPVVRR